jgi:hypothetical protein
MVFAKFSSLWVFWWTIKHFLAILFQKGSKRGTDSEILHIHLVCIIFIFRPILMWLSSLNWLWRDFLVECRWVYILNISPNVFELKLTKRCQFPNFEGFYYFLLNCNSFFVVVKMFIFMRYLWVNTENKLLFFFGKGGKRDTNFKFLHICKVYTDFIYHLDFDVVVFFEIDCDKGFL